MDILESPSSRCPKIGRVVKTIVSVALRANSIDAEQVQGAEVGRLVQEGSRYLSSLRRKIGVLIASHLRCPEPSFADLFAALEAATHEGLLQGLSGNEAKFLVLQIFAKSCSSGGGYSNVFQSLPKALEDFRRLISSQPDGGAEFISDAWQHWPYRNCTSSISIYKMLRRSKNYATS